MADIASLADAIESLKIEVQSTGGQQIAFLDSIALDMSGMLDNSNTMVEELRLLREALAPDNAFERAGQTEREREAGLSGQNVTPDQQAIKPMGKSVYRAKECLWVPRLLVALPHYLQHSQDCLTLMQIN